MYLLILNYKSLLRGNGNLQLNLIPTIAKMSNFHLSAIWTHISVISKSQKIVLFLVYKVKYRSALLLRQGIRTFNRFFIKIARNFKLPLIGETQIEVSEKSRVLDCVRFCALTSFTAAVHRVAHICPFSA